MTRGRTVDVVLIAVPIALWCAHIFWLLPLLGTILGERQFITAAQFFVGSGAIMIVCEIGSLWRLASSKGRRWPAAVAAALNLSWIYYLKVLQWGPTIGNF